MNAWWATQEWPCVCNRGDRWIHTHYPDGDHRCARCLECNCYRPDMPEHAAIRILLGPEMTNEEAAGILLGPEPREPEPPLLMIALTADDLYIVRLALSYYANVGTPPARLNEHIAAARAIELRAAVRPGSAPSLEPPLRLRTFEMLADDLRRLIRSEAGRIAYVDDELDELCARYRTIVEDKNQAVARQAALETRIAELEASLQDEDVVLKVEVIREEDGRFAASWERGNEAGMAAYSATVVGALAELCATLIKVDEDLAHERLARGKEG